MNFTKASLSAGIFLTFAMISTPGAPARAAKEMVNKIVAIVNSELVLQSELDSFPLRLKKDGSVDDSVALDDTPDALKADKKKQLEYLIRERMIESEVKKQNLTVTEDRVNTEIENLTKRNNMSKSQLNEYIKNQGYTQGEYRQTLKSRIERQAFFEAEVISKLRITDEDAYSEFRSKNPNYVPSLNEFTIAQIFFSNRKGADQALQRAEDVRTKITTGESFETLANTQGDDTGNKDGYLGTFKAGEFIKEIETEISKLAPGEVSRVVKSKQGYHIVKVIDKKNTQDPNFVRIKDQIKSYLVEKNFKRQLKNWFESKKQDSYIQIL